MIETTVAGLAGIPDDTRVVWYERDPARAATLATVLASIPTVELTRIVAAQNPF